MHICQKPQAVSHYSGRDTESVASIDSIMASISGFGPNDPDYVAPSFEINGVDDIAAPTQEDYDDANASWSSFVELCLTGEIRKAHEFYNDNRDDFAICFKHSTPRYRFISEVMTPMIFEFEPEDSVNSTLLSTLEFEYSMEYLTMEYSVGNTDYIPETFPNIAVDYGCVLAYLGRLDETFEIIEPYASAISGLTGSGAYAKCYCLLTLR